MNIPTCCNCGNRTRPCHTILDEEDDDHLVARPICGLCLARLIADVERVGKVLRVQEVEPAEVGAQ